MTLLFFFPFLLSTLSESPTLQRPESKDGQGGENTEGLGAWW